MRRLRAAHLIAAASLLLVTPSARAQTGAPPDVDQRGDHSAWNLEGFAAVGFRESRENSPPPTY
jgi:hypothetical protein